MPKDTFPYSPGELFNQNVLESVNDASPLETQMHKQTPVQVVFGVTGLQTEVDGLTTTSDHVTRITLPASFSADDLQTMQRDLEILLDKVKTSPDEVLSLQNSIAEQNLGRAQFIARNLGLTEAEFQTQGGGYVWVVVGVIAVAAALLLASDSPPASSEGGSNAGTG